MVYRSDPEFKACTRDVTHQKPPMSGLESRYRQPHVMTDPSATGTVGIFLGVYGVSRCRQVRVPTSDTPPEHAPIQPVDFPQCPVLLVYIGMSPNQAKQVAIFAALYLSTLHTYYSHEPC